MSKQPVRRRLFDALLDDITLLPLPAEDVVLDPREIANHTDLVRTMCSGAKVIEASNVARYFDESYIIGADGGAAWKRDLKCLVPPYDRFFIEWEQPQVAGALRMGVLYHVIKPGTGSESERLAKAIAPKTYAAICEREREQPHWVYLTFTFIEFHKRPEHITALRGPYGIAFWAIDKDGNELGGAYAPNIDIVREQQNQVTFASLVSWTTLSMLNCANIDTIERTVSAGYQKARAKSGKRPLVSYRTIRVNMERTPHSIGRQDLPPVDNEGKRLHAKRGHIKDYRKGNGLFGRYKGVWYWGPQLAGDEAEGIVMSDYKMEGANR